MNAVSPVKRSTWGGILMAAMTAFADAPPALAGDPPDTWEFRQLKRAATGEHFVAPPSVADAEDSEPDIVDLFLAYLFDDEGEVGCYVGRFTGGQLMESETASGTGPWPIFAEIRINSKGYAATRSGTQGNFLAVELRASTTNIGTIDIIPRSGPYAAMGDQIAIAVNGTIAYAAGAGQFGGYNAIYQGATGTNATPLVDITGMFDTLYPPAMNNSGEMVFPGFEDNDTAGFYKYTGGSTWTLADSNHGYPAFGDGAINDRSSTAFRAIETATGREQIKLSLHGSLELKTVGPLGEYDALGNPSINYRDEVATETFKNTSRTIYFQGNTGFRPGPVFQNAPASAEGGATLAQLPAPAPIVVIKTGDALSGSTVTDLKMSAQALTDKGQIVFHANLADGTEAIYLATPKRSALLNIATRLRVLTGENVLIGGFIITGSDPKKVIIRGIGPSLSAFGVPGALADPGLELHQGKATLATNYNWKIRASDGGSQQAEIEATGLAPSNDAESALVATLAPGNYTAILSGSNNGVGVGLIEVYDLDQAANSQAGNISTRGFVDTGDNVMIGGIIAGPSNAISTRVLIRAIGPTLGNFGVGNPLANPFLELHDSSGATLYTNDDWKMRPDGTSQQADIEETGLAPTNNLESAILGTLPPGNYTAIVRGTGNSSGVALVEVYNLK
jgi:hypothetical protein